MQRGQNIFFSGALVGDDVAEKTITLSVNDIDGNTMATVNTTTTNEGFYDYTWLIPALCSIGKHSLSVSSELLSATDNFIVKLAAPQKYGKKCSQLGEFDAIIASSETVYLIESKWDNLSRFNKDKIAIKPEQKLRHRIFSLKNTFLDLDITI